MKSATSILLTGWLVLLLSACLPPSAVSEPQIDLPSRTPPAVTAAHPTATIVWFPPSETPTPQDIPTQRPTPERKPGVGILLLTDDFSSAVMWGPAAADDTTVSLGQGQLTMSVQPGVGAYRLRAGDVFADFYAEVTAQPSLCRDGDEYGLLFRAPTDVAYYAFVLSCDGTARAERVRIDREYPLHAAVLSADAPLGAPGKVRIGVWASGPDLRFFLNGHYQFAVSDATLKIGTLGVFARSKGDTPVTVLFSDLTVSNVSYFASGTPTP